MSETPGRVWIVEPVGYDQYGIEGVYATCEAATAAVDWCSWEEAEGGWYTKGAGAMDGGYHAYETEVVTLEAILADRARKAAAKGGKR